MGSPGSARRDNQFGMARIDPLAYLGQQARRNGRPRCTYQRLRVLEGPSAAESRFDGKDVINLASNNYLGLTTHPKADRGRDRGRRANMAPGPARSAPSPAPWICTCELEHRIAHIQKRGSLRRVSIRLRGQCRHGGGDPHAGGSHRLRRAEPCQHHRRLPAVEVRKSMFSRIRITRRRDRFWMNSITSRP